MEIAPIPYGRVLSRRFKLVVGPIIDIDFRYVLCYNECISKMKMDKKECAVYQERIAQALQEGNVPKAVEVRAEMYRKGSERLSEDDREV